MVCILCIEKVLTMKNNLKQKNEGIFTSSDLDESRFYLSHLFKPHELNILGKEQLLDVKVANTDFDKLSFINMRHGANVEIYPGKLENFFLLQVPVSGTGEVRIDSTKIDCSPEVAYMMSPTFDVEMKFLKNCEHVILKIERNNLESFLERQLQRTLNVPLEFQPAVYIREGKNQELMSMITYISQQLSSPQSTLHHSMIRDQVTSLLMSTLLISLDHNYHTELTQEVSAPKPFYVKKAQEYIHEHAMDPITPEDIAQAACISLRSVFAGFKTYLNTTPMAYLKDIRLQLVHNDLKSRDPSETSVTDLALKYGFTHFGNFAAGYRERFGELPNETLKKITIFS